MAYAGSIIVDMVGNFAEFIRGMKNVDNSVQSTHHKIQEFGSMSEKVFSRLKDVLSVGAIVGALKSTADAGAEFVKMSREVGMSVEQISALKFAAEQSETGIDTIVRGLGIFSKHLTEIASGSGKEAKEVIDQLGVSLKDAGGKTKSTHELFLEMAGVFSKMEDGAIKTGTAMTLFGRNGKEMLNVFSEGRGGIEELEAKAKSLGVTMSTESATSAKDFEDNIKELWSGIKGLTYTLGNDLIPVLLKFSATVTPILQTLQSALHWLLNNIIMPSITGWEMLTTAASGFFQKMSGFGNWVLSGFKGGLSGFNDLMQSIDDTTTKKMTDIYNKWQYGLVEVTKKQPKKTPFEFIDEPSMKGMESKAREIEKLLSEISLAGVKGKEKEILAVELWYKESIRKLNDYRKEVEKTKGSMSLVDNATIKVEEERNRRLLEVNEKYNKEIISKEIELLGEKVKSLTTWREYFKSCYDYAIGKVKEYRDIAKSATEVSKSITDYLTGKNAAKLTPFEEMKKEKDTFFASIGKAWKTSGQDAIDASMKAFEEGKAFIDKYEGEGFSTLFDTSDVSYNLERLSSHLDALSTSNDMLANSWQATASQYVADIQNIDNWISVLDEKIKALKLSIETAEAVQQVASAKAAIDAIMPDIMTKTIVINTVNTGGGGSVGNITTGSSFDVIMPSEQGAMFQPETTLFPMSQPEASYASGTPYVPKTGIYQLHQGEAVIPASQNKTASTINFSPSIVVNGSNGSGIASDIDAQLAILWKGNRSKLRKEMER